MSDRHDAVLVNAGSYESIPKSSSFTLIWRRSIARIVSSGISSSYCSPVRLSVTDRVFLPPSPTAPLPCVSVSVVLMPSPLANASLPDSTAVAIRTVIFDCDGVLVDSEPLSNAALASTLTDLGMPTTTEEATRRYKGRSWASVEADVAARTGGDPPPGLRARYREAMFAVFARELRPVPGIAAALDAIDLPACVASSGELEKMRYTLGHTALLARFEGRLFSATEVERGKPAPDLFLHAAAELGWDPRTTAVVEDSPVGVEAGVAAGMTVLGYARETEPAELAAAGAAAVFADMAELPALVPPRA